VTAPPLPLLVAYRLFGWRLGPSYREWTYDDITRRGYTLRQALPVALVIGALLAGLFEVTGSPAVRALPPTVGVLVLAYFLRKALRERALRQQGLAPDGEPEATWFADDDERHRRNVISALTTAVLVVAGLSFLAFGRD
jgi:hypothetical protein